MNLRDRERRHIPSRANPALAALMVVVVVLVVGTAAQIAAERLKLPAVGPLLVAGHLLGPAALALVLPELLGPQLRVIVRAAVAVCVFEGGLLLDVQELRRTSRAVRRLITVGLLVTTVLAAACARSRSWRCAASSWQSSGAASGLSHRVAQRNRASATY